MNGMKVNLTLVVFCVTIFYAQSIGTNLHSLIYLLVNCPTCVTLT